MVLIKKAPVLPKRLIIFASSFTSALFKHISFNVVWVAESCHFNNELYGSAKSYPQNWKRLHRRTETEVMHAECIWDHTQSSHGNSSSRNQQLNIRVLLTKSKGWKCCILFGFIGIVYYDVFFFYIIVIDSKDLSSLLINLLFVCF